MSKIHLSPKEAKELIYSPLVLEDKLFDTRRWATVNRIIVWNPTDDTYWKTFSYYNENEGTSFGYGWDPEGVEFERVVPFDRVVTDYRIFKSTENNEQA